MGGGNYTDSEENTPFLLWQVEGSQERVGMGVCWPLRQPDGAVSTTGQVTRKSSGREGLHLQSVTKESPTSAGAPGSSQVCARALCPRAAAQPVRAAWLLHSLCCLSPLFRCQHTPITSWHRGAGGLAHNESRANPTTGKPIARTHRLPKAQRAREPSSALQGPWVRNNEPRSCFRPHHCIPGGLRR